MFLNIFVDENESIASVSPNEEQQKPPRGKAPGMGDILSSGPIIFEGRSSYFTTLYKEVYSLSSFAIRRSYEVNHITPAVSCVLNYANLSKLELEHMKTQLEQILANEYVPKQFASDLSTTDSEADDDDDDEHSPYASDSQNSQTLPHVDSTVSETQCASISQQDDTNYPGQCFQASTHVEQEHVTQIKLDGDINPMSPSPVSSGEIVSDDIQQCTSSDASEQTYTSRRTGIATTTSTSQDMVGSELYKFVPPPLFC